MLQRFPGDKEVSHWDSYYHVLHVLDDFLAV